MVEVVSPLHGHVEKGRRGLVGEDGPAIRVTERPIASLWQIAAWPDRVAQAAGVASAAAGVEEAPGPLGSASGTSATLLRTEPLKWWLIAGTELPRPDLGPNDGTILDLGHARTVIRVEGPATADLMARLVPLDLRPKAFPDGAVATTGMHHVGVTLHRRDGGLDLYMPRNFARSLCGHMLAVAAQFGVEVA